jgi:ABC-type transport system substrate-binding protein
MPMDRPLGHTSGNGPAKGARRWLRLAVASGLLLAGQAASSTHAAADTPRRGGTLIYAENFGAFDSFIPVVSPAEIVDDEAQVLLFRPLLWIGQQASIEYDRSIAKSISVSKDLTTYTVLMRNDYNCRTARRSPPPTCSIAST